MDKFGRNYSLSIQTDDSGGFLLVQPPFTIEFDITRNTLSSANVCQIRIYNLSLKNRNQIRFNVYEYATFKAIELRAGYGTNLPVIFSGNITQSWSVREGVNFISQIECYDGGFAFTNGVTNTQFPAGITQHTVIATMAATLPHTKVGAIGSFPGTLSRGNSYSGNTVDILRGITGGGFFIDKGRANALGTSEYIAAPDGTTLVNSQSGLLGTPILENNILRFDMVFEPGLNVGERIVLTSITGMNFNGSYKVTGVKHRGMISESVCGSVITTGEFLYLKTQTPVF